ncbi:cytochrome-c peroxidase [Flavobacterium okayamense]|uniref:Cytochrome-c peroxidase n=1 Tax=Flavobacterium okayamense TaxID=2830782 RepID=A0ABN6HYH2_9FLAO|nr:cytochrome c peroxidase [Flavobacterium okayamense]BCY28805.1 cytochrome-c peroxidase [Flavobacterium okayamense]
MRIFILSLIVVMLTSCNDNTSSSYDYYAIENTFGNNLHLSSPLNYANQNVPNYITKDNGTNNPINDKIATLGRVLFYDTNLSSNNTTSCATCHKQESAFSDTEIASSGANGTTGRHSMRLINNRFSDEVKYFWNERANSLEEQSTMPIKDHGEMGFSGENGDPSFTDLLTKLGAIDYYNELFNYAYGTNEITEVKIQTALAQFVRSIQSFDSKYDAGRILAPNDGAPFTNFTAEENQGKQLFLAPPQFDGTGSRTGGGLGCAGCHRAPEFDIDPLSLNNGIIGVIGSTTTIDVNNTKAPSLRDLISPTGNSNGPFMHTGNLSTLQATVNHYNSINVAPGNTNLDPRLTPGGNPQQLNLTLNEVNAVVAFLNTLTGSDVYTNEKWSNPFPN